MKGRSFFSRSSRGELAITSAAGEVTSSSVQTLWRRTHLLKPFTALQESTSCSFGGAATEPSGTTSPGEFLPWAIRHEDLIYSASFTPDEERVLTASYDRTARAWDLKTGQQAGFAMQHEAGVVCVCQSPDQETIATGSFDRTVKLWNASTYSAKSQNHVLYHGAPLAWTRSINSDLLLSHCQDGTTYLLVHQTQA